MIITGQAENKEMTIEEIKTLIKKSEYEVYGIRVDDNVKYNVGDTCYKSHQWWQDEPYEDCDLEYNEDMSCWDGGELPGTCALLVTEKNVEKILKQSEMYIGDYVTLIAGNVYELGNDIGEIIIENAIVLAHN